MYVYVENLDTFVRYDRPCEASFKIWQRVIISETFENDVNNKIKTINFIAGKFEFMIKWSSDEERT